MLFLSHHGPVVYMRGRNITVAAILIICLWTGLYAFQGRRGGMRPWWYDEDQAVVTPPDANEKTEYAFARLRYPSYGRGPGGIWALRGNWTIDYPKADRQFVQGVRRLDAAPHPLGRASGRSRNRRNLQLALGLRGRTRTLGTE